MKLKICILIVSVFYIVSLSIVGYSNYCNNRALAVEGEGSFYKALKYLDIAQRLNPINSDISYAKFTILNDKFNKAKGLTYRERAELLEGALGELKKAINLRPTEASYHMFYGLALLKRYPLRKGVIYEQAKRELLKAHELNPASKKYESISNRF